MKKILGFIISPFIISSVVFTLIQLQVFNLGIGFRDEGFLYLGASRILNGEIPYRDFFMTTTPGSFYFQALLIEIFGSKLIVGRAIYILCVISTLFLVNLIYKAQIYKKYIALISIDILLIAPGAFGFYNIEALPLILVAFLLLTKGVDDKKSKYIFLSGIFISLVFVFKQSYGIWLGAGSLIYILTERYKRYGYNDPYLKSFIFGCILPLIPIFAYFHLNNSLAQMYFYLVDFAREVKSHRASFIIRSLISIPFIYLVAKYVVSNKRINVLTKSKNRLFLLGIIFLFIIGVAFVGFVDLSRLYYALLLVIPVLVIAISKSHKLLRAMAIFLLFFFLANASSGRELGTVKIVSPFLIPLTIELIDFINQKLKLVKKNYIPVLIFILIFIQVIILSWDLIKLDRKFFGKYEIDDLNYTLNNEIANKIYVSKQVKEELEKISLNLNAYPENMKLLCFPYCPMLNVLTRRDSPSYFSFFYFETFSESSQDALIDELKNEDYILILQKTGEIEPEAEYEDERLKKIKKYISEHHVKTLETDNFVIYNKKNEN